MKTQFFTFFFMLLTISYCADAQTWLGSTTTFGLTYRDGNVVVGGTSLAGSYASTERVLQLQGAATTLSMYSTTTGGFLQIGYSGTYGTGLYSRAAQISFWTSPTVSGGLAERMRIGTDGNVGIGTTNPGSFKLAVEGKIGAREVQVTLASPWPDYVFEDDYKLPSLTEVASFIKKNKHLPDIPTSEEIQKNGHKLGEMDVLLLKKIEEMMLYILQQEKRIIELENNIKELKNR